MHPLFTIGHSNHPVEYFIQLLDTFNIEVVADVRQLPYSRYADHFNRELIEKTLIKSGMKYVFVGDQLGARPSSRTYYTKGRVDFIRLAKAPFFTEGITRLRNGMQEHRIALMCSEKDPITCHRTILVCRNLSCMEKNADIQHIISNGILESHSELETRLLQLHRLNHPDMFDSREQRLQNAYDIQGSKIAASADKHAS